MQSASAGFWIVGKQLALGTDKADQCFIEASTGIESRWGTRHPAHGSCDRVGAEVGRVLQVGVEGPNDGQVVPYGRLRGLLAPRSPAIG